MITSLLSSEKSTFAAAVGQWASLSNNEQLSTLRCLIEQVLKVISDRGLKIPAAGFLDFAVRAGLHNFQILVAAGNEKDSPENRDRFCTDFILQLVGQPESAPSSH